MSNLKIYELYVLFILGVCNGVKLSGPREGCVTIRGNDNYFGCSNPYLKLTRIPYSLPSWLVQVEVVNQNISSLTPDQLAGILELKALKLDRDNLYRIDPDAFINVPKLQHLSLRMNLLVLGEMSFPSAALLHLKNLSSLNLEGNPLGFVPDFFFRSLNVLRKLTLRGAAFKFYLEPNGLVGLTSLESLDLSVSHLTTLDKQIEVAFDNMRLIELFLFENGWNCDCNLKWLKKWIEKSTTLNITVAYKSSTGERLVAEPKCNTPLHLSNRKLFRTSSNNNGTALEQLNCPPRSFTGHPQIQTEEGKNLTLQCEFESYPEGVVQWSLNNYGVETDGKRTSCGQTSGMRFTAWFSISRVDKRDDGVWRCLLATALGTDYSTFSVTVNHAIRNHHTYMGLWIPCLILLLCRNRPISCM